MLYRVPNNARARSNGYESIVAAFAILLEQERVPDKPLERLGFLGPDREKMKVLDQQVQKVTEDGHQWLDYRLTVSHAGLTQPMRMFFRADAVSKLPQLCRIDGEWNGKPASHETRFDYPEQGPTDIYELGVPKTATLVDRVPTGDIKRIIETLEAGRERMDDYRCLEVDSDENSDKNASRWTAFPMLMYRKGDKLRCDYVNGWKGEIGAVQPPAAGEDITAWWWQRAKFFWFYPKYIMHGSTLYTTESKSSDPDGSEHAEIVAVKKYDYNNKPGDTFPPEYSMRPEFACRPPLGIGNTHSQPVLNLKPTDGPAGCILLTVGNTSQEGRINEKGIGRPDEIRCWLDPERDYIVMRWDMVTRDDAGKEELVSSTITEEVAKSPRGVWYATKIRRRNASMDVSTGKKFDSFYQLYVDFDVDLPDAFFDPPVPGRIR